MSGAVIWVLVFLVVALIALVVVWYLARRVKTDLDNGPTAAAGARAVLELTPASVASLRGLSAEPILLKQGEGGVRADRAPSDAPAHGVRREGCEQCPRGGGRSRVGAVGAGVGGSRDGP